MDNGSWGETVYDKKPYMIISEHKGEYCSVWKDYKQIASFKEKDKAFEYVGFLNQEPSWPGL